MTIDEQLSKRPEGLSIKLRLQGVGLTEGPTLFWVFVGAPALLVFISFLCLEIYGQSMSTFTTLRNLISKHYKRDYAYCYFTKLI